MQNSIPSRMELKTFRKKLGKMLLVVHLSFLLKKEWLKIFLFEKQQLYANPLFALTLANYTPARCVNPCQLVFIRVRILIRKRVYLCLDKTIPAVSEIWFCLFFNEQEQHVKLKASLQQADKKMFALLLMGFDLIATLCLKPYLAFNTSVPIKK